jgi:hypothetical protein
MPLKTGHPRVYRVRADNNGQLDESSTQEVFCERFKGGKLETTSAHAGGQSSRRAPCA